MGHKLILESRRISTRATVCTRHPRETTHSTPCTATSQDWPMSTIYPFQCRHVRKMSVILRISASPENRSNLAWITRFTFTKFSVANCRAKDRVGWTSPRELKPLGPFSETTSPVPLTIPVMTADRLKNREDSRGSQTMTRQFLRCLLHLEAIRAVRRHCSSHRYAGLTTLSCSDLHTKLQIQGLAVPPSSIVGHRGLHSDRLRCIGTICLHAVHMFLAAPGFHA